MGSKRQIVLTRRSAKPGDPAEPLGTLREVLKALARFNTAPDGSKRKMAGLEVAHGPGMVVELPSATDDVGQAMVTMTDEEIAFPVLQRMCRTHGWAMVDLESGRTFG